MELRSCSRRFWRVRHKLVWLAASIFCWELSARVSKLAHVWGLLCMVQKCFRADGTRDRFSETFAAASAVGVLLQLNASQFEDALGMAGTQSSGLTGARSSERCADGCSTALLHRNGLHAAFLAAAGYTGIKKIFELQHGGFLSVFGEAHSPDPSVISTELGKRWEIERIITKTYALMRGLHAPLDALFEVAS
jgi:2-methylcitrate dehydratase PrpD